jgi:uncharacterized protein (DUF169 family)
VQHPAQRSEAGGHRRNALQLRDGGQAEVDTAGQGMVAADGDARLPARIGMGCSGSRRVEARQDEFLQAGPGVEAPRAG